MKIYRKISFLALLYWTSFGFYACETDNKELEPATLSFNMATADGVLPSEDKSILDELRYDILIYQSPNNPGSADDDVSTFQFWQKAKGEGDGDGLTMTEVKNYSLSIPVKESNRSYLLLIHATPKKVETVLTSSQESFGNTRISMVKDGDNYIPLSKDNYYATHQLTATDIANGVTSVKFLLKRAVGQVVFDVIKCRKNNDNTSTPIDITPPCSSTLDRVRRIRTEVSGVLPSISLTNEALDSEKINLTSDKSIVLDEGYLPIFNKNGGVIEQLISGANLPDKSNKSVKGGTRICGPYLLAAQDLTEAPITEGGISIVLRFSYFDTTETSEGKYNQKELTLDLSSKKQQVVKDCYTVTNIRILNDRIIDINVPGNIEIDYKWDK